MTDQVAFVPFKEHERTAAVLSSDDLWNTLSVSFKILRGLKYNWEQLPRDPRDPRPPKSKDVSDPHDPGSKLLAHLTKSVTMWDGHARAFSQYVDAMLTEMLKRRLADDTPFLKQLGYLLGWARKTDPLTGNPWWWGNRDVHHSHRLLLCDRNWDFYGPRFPTVFDSDVSAGHGPYFPPPRMSDPLTHEWVAHVDEWVPLEVWPPKDVPIWQGNPVRDVTYDPEKRVVVLTTLEQNGDRHNQSFDIGAAEDTLGIRFDQVQEVRTNLYGLWDRHYKNNPPKKVRPVPLPTRDPGMGHAMAAALEKKRGEDLTRDMAEQINKDVRATLLDQLRKNGQ